MSNSLIDEPKGPSSTGKGAKRDEIYGYGNAWAQTVDENGRVVGRRKALNYALIKGIGQDAEIAAIEEAQKAGDADTVKAMFCAMIMDLEWDFRSSKKQAPREVKAPTSSKAVEELLNAMRLRQAQAASWSP